MGMLFMNKDAYVISDILIYLFIIAMLSLFTLNYSNIDKKPHYYFINDYYLKQIDSYKNKRVNYLDEYGLHFNESGNISQGKTIYFDNHKVIIHLSNGYLTYE